MSTRDEDPKPERPLSDDPARSEYPDETSRHEDGVSMDFSAATGRRIKRLVGSAAGGREKAVRPASAIAVS
jgi:hypothetical protein